MDCECTPEPPARRTQWGAAFRVGENDRYMAGLAVKPLERWMFHADYLWANGQRATVRDENWTDLAWINMLKAELPQQKALFVGATALW